MSKPGIGPTGPAAPPGPSGAAAARARIDAAARRRRLLLVSGAVLAVLVVVGALVIVKLSTGAGSPKSGPSATPAPIGVAQQVGSVPASVLDQVGAGSVLAAPKAISGGTPLTSAGKPEVLYVGAEFCPYCAAERWAVAVALSRFGTLHGLGQITSAPSPEVYPSTATLSFHGATYTSSTLVFVPREVQSNQVVDGQYTPLDKLTIAQQKLVAKYDVPPYSKSSGGIPFVDIGGRYVISGASYDPGVLQGKTHEQIAQALSDPSSAVAQAVDGTANVVTAAICAATGQSPAAVCSSPGVRAAAAKLPSGS